jgi:hypothetical protein
VEYLRWLQQQSRLFLKPAYTEDDIAQLPDSDGDNEVVDEYNELTRGGTVQPEREPFQNYMVSIFFVHVVFSIFLSEVLIYDSCLQALQLGRFTNEAGNMLSHPPNSAASHNALRAFAEVSLVSIFFVHRNVLSN